jgi:hypothetical protein
MGFALGLLTSSYIIPWFGQDFMRSRELHDMIWDTWIFHYGLIFVGIWAAVIIFKFIPDIYEVKTGNKWSWFNKRSNLYRKETPIQ